MTTLVFHVDRATLPTAPSDGEIHVWLYGGRPPFEHVGTVGAQALDTASRMRVRPSTASIDLLSIAMAVTAADTFVVRGDAPDCWSRSFRVVLPLAEPATWTPLIAKLEAALRFLSSDRWSFDFTSGGVTPPTAQEIESKRRTVDLSASDCVALFSGGLDSGIGVLDLLKAGHRPVLVSHAPVGDAEHQDKVAALLPIACQRVSVNTYPTCPGADEDSMRTRSFQFIALGTLVADARTRISRRRVTELYVCENGLIALNPPLTVRRIGAHSTRTAHVHFLESISQIVADVGIGINIRNPYEYSTKGEMIAAHADTSAFDEFVAATVSCGKWKRRRQQCGRCVPCLIRRAALHSAGVDERTLYQSADLAGVMSNEDLRDDLVSVQSAILRLADGDIRRWVLQAGPLPLEDSMRLRYFDVARRGLGELASYLRAVGFSL